MNGKLRGKWNIFSKYLITLQFQCPFSIPSITSPNSSCCKLLENHFVPLVSFDVVLYKYSVKCRYKMKERKQRFVSRKGE